MFMQLEGNYVAKIVIANNIGKYTNVRKLEQIPIQFEPLKLCYFVVDIN